MSTRSRTFVISRPRPSLARRTGTIASIVGAAAGASIVGRRAIASSKQSSRRKSSRGSRAIGQQRETVSRWNTEIPHQLRLDKGDTAFLIEACQPSNRHGMTGAPALAAMDFLAEQTSDARGEAQRMVHTLLAQTFPHGSVTSHAEAEQKRAQRLGDDQLTAQLQQVETTYLRYLHGLSGKGYRVGQLINKLQRLATTLDERGDSRRAASALMIIADLNLRQGRHDEATTQMEMAIAQMRQISDLVESYEVQSSRELSSH